MRKSAVLLVTGLTLAAAVSAATAPDNVPATRRAAVPTTSAASSPSLSKGSHARGNVVDTGSKETARDPYAVPLFKDARSLR